MKKIGLLTDMMKQGYTTRSSSNNKGRMIYMVKVVAKSFVQMDKIHEYMSLSKELVEETRKEQGCINYGLFQDEKDNTILTMIEEWESKDALQNHLKSAHFTRIVPLLKELRSKESEMNVYTKLI